MKGPQRRIRKEAKLGMKGPLSVALQGRLRNTRVGVWRSSDFTERKRPYLFTPQGTVENALFRTAALTLAYRMPSVRNRGADPLGSHSRTPVLLAGSSLLHLLAFT